MSGGVSAGRRPSACSKNSRCVKTSRAGMDRSVSPCRTVIDGVDTSAAWPASTTPRGTSSVAAPTATRRSILRVASFMSASTWEAVATSEVPRRTCSTPARLPAATAESIRSKKVRRCAAMVSAAPATKSKVGGTDPIASCFSWASSSGAFGTLKGMRAITSSGATIPTS